MPRSSGPLPPRHRHRKPTRPTGARRLTALHDTFLANWVGADNQAEISLNEFASSRASTQDVKDFTQEMIRAHGDLANKLNQAVASLQATAVPRTGRTPYTTGYGSQPGTGQAIPGTAPGSAPSLIPGDTQGTIPGNVQGTAPAATEGSASGQPGGAATIPGGPMASTAPRD